MKNSQQPSALIRATVKHAEKGIYLLDADCGTFTAKCAYSCFLTPAKSDHVLVDYSRSGSYILSVLERDSEESADIQYPDGAVIRAKQGEICMQADRLNLVARENATITSRTTRLASSDLDVLADTITNRSRHIDSYTDTVRLFAQSIDTVVHQVRQRADSIIRWVEGIETLNVGNLVQNVRRSMTTHSTHVVLTAKQDVRIDGERIHMG